MTRPALITDKHEIARLLNLQKGEQAQLVHVSTSNPRNADRELENMRKYLEESIPGMEWVDREQCVYRRPK